MVGKRRFGCLGNEGDSPDSKRRMLSFGQTVCPPRRLSSNQVADRFIPVRSAIDWELAQALLVGPARARPNSAPLTVYQKCIEQAMYNGRTRLLSFNDRLSVTAATPPAAGVSWGGEPTKNERRQVHRTPVESRFCTDIVDDYGLNLLDWGSNNVVALAIGEAVHLWNYSNNSTSQLMELEESGYVASVSWSPGASQIVIGLDENDVMLLDATTTRLPGIIYGTHHRSRIGSLAWNGFTLSTAGRKVINYDVRARDHAPQMVGQHQDEVYALKWSASGRHLASAGADGFVYVWDVRRSGKGEWQHKFKCHPDCAKALAWCPSESNMLAASGDESDRHIVFWNTHTGSPFCSVDTGSEVSEFLWSCDGREFVTSHGSPENQLMLWKYSSMVKLADLSGHELPVLFMSQSPDGSMVASVGAEEALLVWKDVFMKRASKKSVLEPFAAFGRISCDGREFVTSHGSPENQLMLGKYSSVVKQADLRGHELPVLFMSQNLDGSMVASVGAEEALLVWKDVFVKGASEKSVSEPFAAFGRVRLNVPYATFKFKCHPDCAKALAWCPSESNMLAASGDESDRHIVFWNTHTGSPFCSVDTGSEVSEFLWSCDGREFVTSHGSPENQLTLWKYSSMVKLADLSGHELPVLFMSQSPDGSMVSSVGAEEALLVWKYVFMKRASKKSVLEPFAAFGRIR